MTQKEARSMAASLNDNQRFALRRLLQNGEEQRQANGRSRLNRKDCRAYYNDRGIATQTSRALTRRGLCSESYFSPHLTPNGVKVARIVFSEWLERLHADVFETEAEGIVFKPTTVEEYVAGLRAEQEQEEREHEEQTKRAVHLWRNIRLPEPWEYGSKSPWMASAIKSEFNPNRLSRRRGINLDLERLIYIGEQIEKLRQD